MQAVILAGGVGSRLRPITDTMPKPLCPIANESAMARVLKLLARHGCRDATVTLCYLPQQIMDTFGESAYGVTLHYVCEDKPCGTAGSVKLATPFLYEDDFLVISADVVCETDLSALLQYHKQKKALATLALTHQCEVGEYGVVVLQEDGQIDRFLEKPARAQACSDTVNSGIYCLNRSVLDRIPPSTAYDFGRDLFPSLLGHRLYGYVDDAPWCDVGSVESYYDCNFRIARKEGAVQESNIMAPSVTVHETATVKNSILMQGVKVGAYCHIDGAILCENVTVRDHAKIGKGAVIGANSIIREGCEIGQGVSVVAKGVPPAHWVKTTQYAYAQNQSQFFSDGGLHGRKEELTPEFLLRFGRASAEVAGGRPIAVLHADTAYCSLLCSAFRCGVISAGGVLCYFGVGFCASAAFCAKKYGMLTFCIYEDASAAVRVAFYDAQGLYPHRKIERALCQAFASSQSLRADKIGFCEAKKSIASVYQKNLQEAMGNLDGMRIYFNYTAPAALCKAACVANGAEVTAHPDALRIVLDPTGRNVAVFESGSEPFSCDVWHILAILLAHDRLPKTLALPYSAPLAITRLAEEQGCEVAYYTACPSGDSENAVRELASNTPVLQDASLAVAYLLRLCRESGKRVQTLAKSVPPFYTFVREMAADARTRLKILCALGKTDGEGVCIAYSPVRRVRVLPLGVSSYRMICEGESVEAADEIFSLSQAKIKALMQEYRQKEEK